MFYVATRVIKLTCHCYSQCMPLHTLGGYLSIEEHIIEEISVRLIQAETVNIMW